MPHQCLGCGHLFPEGSSDILRGCPACKGTRFFYTQTPISDAERQGLAEKAQRDLRSVVADMLQEAAPATAARLGAADDGKWAELTPKDVRRIIREVQAERATAPRPALWENPDPQPVKAPPTAEAARARIKAVAAQATGSVRPDTVNVRTPGEYEIDVKALLERSPIVVHKDGAYLIHLPSLFDQGKK